MSSMIDGLLYCWQKNTDYAPKLVSDLTEDQMLLQLAPSEMAPANHPAWVFSHLNIYLPVLLSLIRGESFEDPRDHVFGMLSSPKSDPEIYPCRNELIESYLQGHLEVADMLTESNDSIFELPVKLPRWAGVMPRVGIALPYLMLNHENQHLGQLSAWRRIQGLPSV